MGHVFIFYSCDVFVTCYVSNDIMYVSNQVAYFHCHMVLLTPKMTFWTWFFEQFKNVFDERKDMCVVSDRNESIMKSVRIVFPNVPHYACI